jgi:fructokinase
VVGTGLVALDVIVDETSNVVDLRAGGTCGNVLTILGYLGWRSVPLGRLAKDAPFSVVASDLKRWGVDTNHLTLGPATPTPVIVELLRERGHRFLLVCPSCGAHLPSYRPITLDMARTLPPQLQAPNVFFFDRVSPAAIYLAEQAREAGGLVVCEPSSIRDYALLRRALAVTDILKVSADRIPAEAIRDADGIPLVIETRGAAGLRYRTYGQPWKDLGAFPPLAVRDTAGAGDWCTAGLLFRLGCLGAWLRRDLSDDDLLYDAISFGQALGAWTCGFVGPRGGMYQSSRQGFWEAVTGLVKRRIPRVTIPPADDIAATMMGAEPACAECDVQLAVAARAKHRAS